MAKLLWMMVLGVGLSLPAGAADDAETALALLRNQDYDRAIEVYRRIARAQPDNARAQYDLAAALGFLRRYPEAVEPIEAAIRLAPDLVLAHQAASIIYANNRDPARAFEASLRAAELGEITAMFELVWMYRDGRGVDPSDAKALAWARRAAENGHVGAMDLLVDTYLNGGFGVTSDLERAGHWAKTAWRARRPGTGAARR